MLEWLHEVELAYPLILSALAVVAWGFKQFYDHRSLCARVALLEAVERANTDKASERFGQVYSKLDEMCGLVKGLEGYIRGRESAGS